MGLNYKEINTEEEVKRQESKNTISKQSQNSNPQEIPPFWNKMSSNIHHHYIKVTFFFVYNVFIVTYD